MFVDLKEIHEMRLMCDHEADSVLDSDLKIRPPTDLPVAVISWRYVAYLRNGKNILPPRSLRTVRFGVCIRLLAVPLITHPVLWTSLDKYFSIRMRNRYAMTHKTIYNLNCADVLIFDNLPIELCLGLVSAFLQHHQTGR
jgi:hypothetical protein